MTRRILGIGWQHHDATDDDFDATVDEILALRSEVERLRDLVKEAYREGYNQAEQDAGMGVTLSVVEMWVESDACAALEVIP